MSKTISVKNLTTLVFAAVQCGQPALDQVRQHADERHDVSARRVDGLTQDDPRAAGPHREQARVEQAQQGQCSKLRKVSAASSARSVEHAQQGQCSELSKVSAASSARSVQRAHLCQCSELSKVSVASSARSVQRAQQGQCSRLICVNAARC